jgi:hypothetical protein
MISLEKRFLFVHIPKTGGNSIQSILQNYSEDEIVSSRPGQDGIERFGLRNKNYDIKKHSKLADYRNALGRWKFRRLFKFACVRNPWDRMISFYFSPSKQMAQWDREAFVRLVRRAPSVADYLRLGPDDKDPFANVDCILRFENLAEEFQAVCLELKIAATPLPNYNRSRREHYSQYYDDELRALVADRFAPEIARFGYTFE